MSQFGQNLSLLHTFCLFWGKLLLEGLNLVQVVLLVNLLRLIFDHLLPDGQFQIWILNMFLFELPLKLKHKLMMLVLALINQLLEFFEFRGVISIFLVILLNQLTVAAL